MLKITDQPLYKIARRNRRIASGYYEHPADLVELLNLHAANRCFQRAERLNDIDAMLNHFSKMLHWYRAAKEKQA